MPNYMYSPNGLNGASPVYHYYPTSPQTPVVAIPAHQFYVPVNIAPPPTPTSQPYAHLQLQQQQQTRSVTSAPPAATVSVKSEPQEVNVSNQMPYFTNPIQFKREPSDPLLQQHQQQSQIQQQQQQQLAETTTNGQSKEDAAALNIVSHLLKDQQILNQLEKVAQTFRLN